MVWKPSEDAPVIADLFLRAMMDAGLPDGVVNIVHGGGAGGAGQAMIEGIEKGIKKRQSADEIAESLDLTSLHPNGEDAARNKVSIKAVYLKLKK